MVADANPKDTWLNTIHSKEQQLLSLASSAEEVSARREIAREWIKGIEECSRQAILALLEVLVLCPDDVESLNDLLRLYEEHAMWTEAAATLEKLVEVNAQPETRSKCLVTLGDIYQNHLEDQGSAVRAFKLAFEEGNASKTLFSKLVALLIEQKAWTELEAICLRMMSVLEQQEDISDEGEIRNLLAHTVHVHLAQSNAAVTALANKAFMDIQGVDQLMHVAQVCAANPQTYSQAVELFEKLVQKNPDDIQFYKALGNLHKKMDATDKYWCVCAVLSFVDQATPEERRFYEQHRPNGAIRLQTRLSNDLWTTHLFHPDDSMHIGKMLEALTASVRYLMVQPHKSFGLGESQKRHADDTLLFSKAFFYGAHALGLPRLPDLYIQEERPAGLSYVTTEPPASVCGANFLTGYTLQELQFVVGHHLAYYRPEHYLRWVIPTDDELGTLLDAALQLGDPDHRWPSASINTFNATAVAEHVDALKGRISSSDMRILAQAVEGFAASSESMNVKKWIQTVELTACRAGLLLCNDLDTAIRMIQVVTFEQDTSLIDSKIGALISFCVSEAYHQLRKAMNVALKN